VTDQHEEEARLEDELAEARRQVVQLGQTLSVQQRIAHVAGLFQGDVTVRTLLESLAEGVVVIDHSAVIVLVNKRTQEIFGYSRDELMGRSLGFLLPERLVEIHARHVGNYFKEPRIRPMGRGLDLIGRRKDGTELPLEISLSYLDTKAGLLGLAFVTDITLRKRVETELRQRNEDLDAFAQTVAHDLKAPLAILVGYADALTETFEMLSAEELRQYLERMSQSGHKISEIISELLLFASMRKEDVVRAPLDMTGIVDEALQRLRREVGEGEAEILLPDGYPEALGYAPWVEEVWFNYISNALKYGGCPPHVKLGGTLQDDGYVRFWVRDNGTGLTEEQQARLFAQLERLDQVRVKGHGLGLSIVRRIVEKLGGQVSVESRVGEGSVFSFTLPAAG
jgi:PAS domain S-box-containing protein